MKRRSFLQSSALLAGTTLLPAISTAAPEKSLLSSVALTHRVTDSKAPEVFFVPEVSGQALIRVYQALNQSLKGKDDF